MSFRVQYVVQAQPGETRAPWGAHAVLLGTAELDFTDVVQREDGFWVLRQVPDQLRELADQLEAGMTTGPDEVTWLAPQCDKPYLVAVDPDGLEVRRAACNKQPGHAGDCGPCCEVGAQASPDPCPWHSR